MFAGVWHFDQMLLEGEAAWEVEGRMWLYFRVVVVVGGLFYRSFDLFVGMEVIEAYVLEAGSFILYVLV